MISLCSNSHSGINITQIRHNAIHSPFPQRQMLLLKCMEPFGNEKTDQNTILINVTLNFVLISDDDV